MEEGKKLNENIFGCTDRGRREKEHNKNMHASFIIISRFLWDWSKNEISSINLLLSQRLELKKGKQYDLIDFNKEWFFFSYKTISCSIVENFTFFSSDAINVRVNACMNDINGDGFILFV